MIACTVYEVAGQLLAHLQAHLTQTRAGEADRVFVSPHPEPVIEFCVAGTAYVGIRQVTPRAPGKKCATTWKLDLTVGVHRCFPTEPDNAGPPEVDLDSAARDLCDDLEAMRRAVDEALAGHAWTINSWTSVPPQGGAHGSRMQVSVEVGLGAYTEPRSPKLPGDPRPDPEPEP